MTEKKCYIRERKCKLCSAQFLANDPRQIYCCVKCKDIYKSRTYREKNRALLGERAALLRERKRKHCATYREKNRARIRERARKHYAENPEYSEKRQKLIALARAILAQTGVQI